MKRILCTIFAALMLFSLAACAKEAVLPPTRMTDNKVLAEYDYFTFDKAMSEASVVARIRVGDWIGETKWQTFFEAEVLECLKGEAPVNITLLQDGSSKGVIRGYPLFTSGNEMLVFLNEATDIPEYDSLPEYDSPYWIVGAHMTLMFVSYDTDGNRYYMGTRDSVGRDMEIETNYSGNAEVFDELYAALCEIDPLIRDYYRFPYTFAEAYVVAAIQNWK